jgi:hypothetical protein
MIGMGKGKESRQVEGGDDPWECFARPHYNSNV